MTELGYDLERLDVLRRRVRAAAGLLLELRSADPLAVDAVATIGAVRSRLEHELAPVVTAVLVDDPLGADGAAVDVPAATAVLAGAGIGAAPRVPDQVWADTFDELAAERLALQEQLVWDPENPDLLARMADIDRRIADAAHRYAAGAPTDGHVRWFPTALLDASPYAAALVLAHLDLDDRALGGLAALVVRRWMDGQDDGARWDDAFAGGDNAADVVFRSLGERPAAATVFLLRARPDEVLRSAQFADSLDTLLLAGTDPSRVDEATAGSILRPLLQYLGSHELPVALDGVAEGIPAVMAHAVAPWLADLGPRADRWDWTYEQGDASLRQLLDDRAALASLTAAADDGRRALVTMPWFDDEGRLDDEALRDLASSFAQVQIAVRDAEIDDAIADQLLDRLSLQLASIAIASVVPGGPMASASADTALAVLTPAAAAALDRWGVMPSDERIVDEAGARFGDRAVDTAVIALTGVIGAAVDRGDLPPDALDRLDRALTVDIDADTGDTCAPRAVGDRLHEVVRDLGEDADPATAHALLAVLYAFDNPLSTAQLCN